MNCARLYIFIKFAKFLSFFATFIQKLTNGKDFNILDCLE